MDMAAIIKKRRAELDLTLKQIADIVGVSEGTIQRYESGNIKNMRLDKINKLAFALQLDPAELMGWEKSNKTITNDIVEFRETAIASTLKKLRNSNNMQIDQVIEKLKEYGINISGKTLYAYENNANKVPANTIFILSMIYGVDDVLQTFGYKSNKRNDRPKFTNESLEIAERYDNADLKSQNVVRTALDMEPKKEALAADFDENSQYNKKIS